MGKLGLVVRKIASMIVVIVLVSVLFAGIRDGSASTSPFTNTWSGYTPNTMVDLNDVLSTDTQDSSNNADVSFAVAVDSIVPPPSAGQNYYDVALTTTVLSHCSGLWSYGATTGTVLAQFWRNGDTAILGSDNGGRWVQFPPGRYFPYYGAWYDRVFVAANGFILLGQSGATDTDVETVYTTKTPSSSFPNDAEPNGIIAPLWRDLDPTSYGRIGYGWYTLDNMDTFVVAWEGVKNYANSNLQSFAVRLRPADGYITFVYKTLTKDVTTSVGLENPPGGAGSGNLYTQVRAPTLDVMSTIDFSPSTYNKWQIIDVRVYADKTIAGGWNDVDAAIMPLGGSSLSWGGLNVRLYDPGPSNPPPAYKDKVHLFLARTAQEGVDQIMGCIPVAGQLYDAYGYLKDVYGILEDYKPTYETTFDWMDREPGSITEAMTENLAENSMQVSRGDPSNKVFYLWTAPIFHWYLYDDNLYGNGGLAANDHTISLRAEVLFELPGGSRFSLTTDSLTFTVFKNGDLGLTTGFYDNFDDGFIENPTLNPGSLEDWSVVTGSKGTVSLNSDGSPYSDPYSLYIHHPAGSTGLARITSPHLSVNFQQDYSIVVYVNVSSSGLGSGLHLIVADDGRLEVFVRNAAGVGPQLSVATSTGGFIDDRALPGGKWHMIVVKAFPSIGKFKLYVDGQGGFVDYNFKSTTGVDTLTLGSVLNPGSRDGGDAQFDDIAVYGYLLPHPDLSAGGSVSRTKVTSPGEVSFSCSPSGGLVPYSYLWSFGDGTTSTEKDPVHSYSVTTTTTYQAVVTVTDATRDTAQWRSPSITVVPPLSVGGVASPPSGVCPLTVSFTSTVNGGASPYSYSWTFGDGSTGSGSMTSHVYSAPGTYTAVLTVTDNNGAIATDNDISIAVTNPINQAPVAVITGPSWAIVAEIVTLDGSSSYDQDGTIVAYTCLFGDGGGESATMPPGIITHAYSAAGTYTVTLAVLDDDGSWSPDVTKSIVVCLEAPPSWLVWDDFLDMNTAGWTLTQSGGTVAVDPDRGLPEAPSMMLYKSVRGEVSAKQSFEQQTSGLIVHVNMMTDTNAKSKYCKLELYKGSTRQAAFGFVDGSMRYYLGKAWFSIGVAYVPGQWYDIVLDVKLNAGSYDIYIDGLLKKSSVPLKETPSAVDMVKLSAGEVSHTKFTMWVDDILIRNTNEMFFHDSFSDDLSDWSLVGGGTVRDVVLGNPAAPSMKIVASASVATQYVNHTFASQTNTVVIEEKVRVSGQGNIYVSVGSSVYLCFQPGFCIWYYDGHWEFAAECSLDQWYSLVLVVDVSLQVYDLYIDGRLCAVDAGFFEPETPIDQLGYIVFRPSAGSVTLWVDDVAVYSAL